jgi:transposase
MKKLTLLALALVIGTSTLFASNLNSENLNKNIRDQILKLMEEPNFSIDEETTITILFTFNSEGEIIVLSVDSSNENVLNYVRENLNHKIIANPGAQAKLYTLPLTVKG